MSVPLESLPPGRRLFLAAALIGLTALAAACGVLPILRGSLQSHYGLSNTLFGFLISFGSLAGAAGALAGGPLVDRRGPWFVFRLSAAGCAAGYALGAIPGGVWMMAAALGAVSFFYYSMAIAAQAGLVALFPDRRRRMITAYLVGAAIMGILTPLAAEAQLQAVAAGWISFGGALHGLFALAGLILLAGVAWLRRQGEPPAKAPAAGGNCGAGGLAVGGLWLLVAIAVLHSCCDSMSAVWLPKILAGPSYARHPILPGTAIAVFSIGYLVSRLGLGLLPENKWRRRLLIAPGFAGGLVFLAGLLTRTQAGAAAGYVAGGLCWSLEYPVAVAAMAGDRRFGRAMAVMNVAIGILCFVLPTGQGWAMDFLQEAGRERLAWIVLIPAAAGFFVNGLLGWIWVRRHGHQFESRRG